MLSLTEHSQQVCSIRDNDFCPKILNFVYKCVVPIHIIKTSLLVCAEGYDINKSYLIRANAAKHRWHVVRIYYNTLVFLGECHAVGLNYFVKSHIINKLPKTKRQKAEMNIISHEKRPFPKNLSLYSYFGSMAYRKASMIVF